MTPTSAPLTVFVHDAVAVCAPAGGLATQKINVRTVAVVPESVPGISVPLTPPRLAVTPAAALLVMMTIIIAARSAPLPTTNDGVVTAVTCHRTPELTELSNATAPRITESMTVVVCVRLPLTPVIVTVKVPAGVLVLVVTERADEVVVGFGAKLLLAPAGNPVTLRLTGSAKPPVRLIVTG